MRTYFSSFRYIFCFLLLQSFALANFFVSDLQHKCVVECDTVCTKFAIHRKIDMLTDLKLIAIHVLIRKGLVGK